MSNSSFEGRKLWYFPKEVSFKCFASFSAGGKVGNFTKFEASCKPDGQFVGVEFCAADRCPMPENWDGTKKPDPFGPYNNFDEEVSLSKRTQRPSPYLFPSKTTCIERKTVDAIVRSNLLFKAKT